VSGKAQAAPATYARGQPATLLAAARARMGSTPGPRRIITGS
jgi:hypothetical protein